MFTTNETKKTTLASGGLRYHQVAELVKGIIERKKLGPNDQLPSLRELVDTFKVSPYTVTRGLTLLEDEGIISRIPGKGTFIERLPSAITHNILTLVDHYRFPSPKDSYVHDIFAAVSRDLDKIGFNNTLRICTRDGYVPTNVSSILGTPSVSGLILDPVLDQQWLHIVRRSMLPAVWLHRKTSNEMGIGSVAPDYYAGGRLMAEYLWKSGHRKIAFLLAAGDQAESLFHDESAAFCEYWESKGAGELFDIYAVDCKDADKIDSNYDRIIPEIVLKKKPTVIVGCDDYAASHALRCVKNIGFSVPKDISIVGFDDLGLAAITEPALTTIRVDPIEIGTSAVDYLVDCIEGKRSPGLNIKTSVKLVVRDSAAIVSSNS